ncbi:MAG TPA: BBE domain-containing protein [Dehalococcoidia bacterium]|nr:BBE domain-containing protein [Dehalococcoidia bacterium]
MPYVDMQRLLEAAFPKGYSYYWKSSLVSDISDGAIDVLLSFAARLPNGTSSVGLQHLHDAAVRVAPGATAFPHRFPHHNFFPTAAWSDPAEAQACVAWAREFWEAMQPYSERANYVNDLGDEPQERVREAYGANYDRLAQLKAKFDPANLFRLNANIPPQS